MCAFKDVCSGRIVGYAMSDRMTSALAVRALDNAVAGGQDQFYVLWPLAMVAILRRGSARLPRVALWLFGVSVAIALLTAVLYVPGDIDSACSATSHHGYWYVFGRCISINDSLYFSPLRRSNVLDRQRWRSRASPLRRPLLDVNSTVIGFAARLSTPTTPRRPRQLTMLTAIEFELWRHLHHRQATAARHFTPQPSTADCWADPVRDVRWHEPPVARQIYQMFTPMFTPLLTPSEGDQ